ncbi:RHS domain-containing protein [Burkholderia lata]|uniref:RHS domain-containing protein n=1 Tax=Burkholderia lata (strain ATCC 17760 / DSM 23089 / LMG 22485 / NCIMB 9086 / R18194 / 383) TaxID=482957 RepID=UPI00399A6677
MIRCSASCASGKGVAVPARTGHVRAAGAAKTRHATLFYQNDHLGTPQELLDESGKVVWLGRYRAWVGSNQTD